MRSRCVAAAVFAVVLGLGISAGEPVTDEQATSLEAVSEDIDVAADGSYAVTAHSEVRAVNEAGAMQASHISLLFDSETQQLEVLEAHTLKRDGSTIPVDLSAIYEQLPPDNNLAVTSFRVKVVLFPQFSAGDTAVYTVRIRNPKAMFAGAFQYGKVFPRMIAYKNARVTLTAPKAFALRVETHDLSFGKEEKGDKAIYTWRLTAPAEKVTTAALVSPLDRERRFFVSSFKDYGELGRAYAVQSEPKAAVTPKIQALADQITTGVTDKRDQARRIYEWMVSHTRYVAILLGRGSFVPHDADSVIAKGYGDCKDHDVLLQALLKAKGVAAESVLINATNAYSLSEAPSFAQLDHVITYLPEFDVYLDASTPVAQFGVLPLQEYGKPAVHASSKSARLGTIPLLKPGAATLHTETVQTIAADGTITGSTTTSATGAYALDLRFIGYAVQALGPEQAATLQMQARGFKDATGKLQADPLSPLGDSYKVRGDYTIKGWKSILDGDSTIMPGGLRVAGLSGDDIMGPFYADDKASGETTVCLSAKADEDVSLEVPAGYGFQNVPKDTRVTTANLTFLSHWSVSGQRLTVHREFVSTIDQALCSGAVRRQTAEALKRIARAYDDTFLIAKPGAAAAKPNMVQESYTAVDRGNAHLDAKDYEAAIKDYDEALRLDPKNAWAFNGRGVARGRLGQNDRALADYNQAIEIDPMYQQAYFNRGDAYLSLAQWDKAIADLNQALVLKPKDVYALLDRGWAYSAQEKYDKAIPDFTAAIAIDPTFAKAYSARASSLMGQNKIALALADIAEALKHDPKEARALALRGASHYAAGRNGAALKDLSDAIASDPSDSYARSVRAQLYERTNQPERAIADINAVLTAQPNDLNMLKMRADLYRKAKKYDLAMADYDRISAKVSDAAIEGFRLAILVETGKADDARARCKKLIADNPERGWPYISCSMMKRRLGDDKGANQDVAKALKLDPSAAKSISVW